MDPLRPYGYFFMVSDPDRAKHSATGKASEGMQPGRMLRPYGYGADNPIEFCYVPNLRLHSRFRFVRTYINFLHVPML